MESAAIGVPAFTSNVEPYAGVVPENQLFSSQDELIEKLFKLKFSSVGLYEKMINQQWGWLNSPTKAGDCQIKNWWMEDNMGIWMNLYRLPNMKDKIIEGKKNG